VDLLGLLEVRHGPAPPVHRHRRPGIQPVEGLGEISGPGAVEREDHRLPLGLPGAVDRVHELLDLAEDIAVGGDDERVRPGVGVDLDGLLAALLGGPRVVALAQHVGQLRGLGRAYLQQLQRWQLRRLVAIEQAHGSLDHLVLGRLGHDVEAVGPLNQLDRRLGHGAGRVDRRGRGQKLAQRPDDIARTRLTQLEQPASPRRRQEPTRLGHGFLIRAHRLGLARDQQVARQGIELGGGGRAVVGIEALTEPLVDEAGLLDQGRGIGARELDHAQLEVTGAGPVERRDQRAEDGELLGQRRDHQQIERVDRLDRGRDVLRTVARLEQLAPQRRQRRYQAARLGVGNFDLTRLAVDDGVVLDHAEGCGEAALCRLGAHGREHAAAGIELDGEHPPRVGHIDLPQVQLARPVDGLLRVGGRQPHQPHRAVHVRRLVKNRDERPDRFHVGARAGDDQRPAVRAGDHLEGHELAAVEQALGRGGHGVGLGVGEGDHGDAPLGLPGHRLSTVDFIQKPRRLVDRRGRADHRDLAQVVQGKNRGALVLGQLRVELVELGRGLLGGEARQGERAQGPAVADGGHVEQHNRLPQLVDPALDPLGDDRVGAGVGREAQPRHRLLLDLHLLSLLIDDVLLDLLAQQRLERPHELLGLGVPERKELDDALGVLAIERVHDGEDPPHLARGLGDHQGVLLLHGRDRAVRGDHERQLLGQGLGQGDVQGPHDRDDLVVADLRRKLPHEDRDVLALHVLQLLEVQHVVADAQGHALGLEDDVEDVQRFVERVRLRGHVVQRALGHVRLPHHRQAGRPREEVDHLVEGRALEVEADDNGLIGRVGAITGRRRRVPARVRRRVRRVRRRRSERHESNSSRGKERRGKAYTEGCEGHPPVSWVGWGHRRRRPSGTSPADDCRSSP
jgi:hypothetical protein